MQYLIVGLIALTAMGLPAQDALNAQLRGAVKSPLLGACVSLIVGALALGLASLTGCAGAGAGRETWRIRRRGSGRAGACWARRR